MEVENIKAMLAHKYNEDKADYPAYIQPKLDGVRCLFTAKGAFSRAGNQFMNVEHIEKALKPFFAKNPTFILDGELYNHGLKDDFEKIISLVRKKKPTDQDKTEAAQLVQYHVYDVANLTIASYTTRLNFISSLTYTYPICKVDTQVALDFDDALEIHKKNLKLGYEGSIYRTFEGKYKGTRSWDLMKFKDFHDDEATIVGYEIGKGKREGTLGKFIMQDDEGVEFGCPPGKGYDYQALTNMLNNVHDYIGQRATFTYFQRTQAGSYRHPHYKCLRNYE
jgi:DNA ligase-1|tara:strand:+ start:448 stop:1284 length:837 start_codon:yes stop_codon:yes gene_type:complete